MATNPTLVAFMLLTFCCIHYCSANQNGTAEGNNSFKFKGMFVFGSSVVDNGNNNYLKGSMGKANYLPYGVDFPSGPTGRFSNGKNVADLIAGLLGLPLVPPFAKCRRTEGRGIVYGVNYGSGGAGILEDTGSITGGVITLSGQINNFVKVTAPQLEQLMGRKPEEILGRYLFLVGAGNNDFELNYFLMDSSSRPSLPVFVANLTSTYATYLQSLYKVGARKFALLTVYPIGCNPVVKQKANSQRCVKIVNAAAIFFNTQLRNMADAFQQKFPDSKFVVVNTYKIIRDIIKNPVARGFSNVTGACCELKEMMGVGMSCKEGGKVCGNRSNYVFFDGQHNTEAVNAVIASKAISSVRKTEAYPFNLQQLSLN